MRFAALPSLALLVVAALAGCTPGGLAPAPQPSTTPPASAAPTATPTPEPADASAHRPVLLATLAASNALAVVDQDAAEPLLDRIEVGRAPWGVATHDGTAFVSTAEGLAIVDLAAGSRTALVPYLHQPAGVAFGEYRDGGLGTRGAAPTSFNSDLDSGFLRTGMFADVPADDVVIEKAEAV